MARVTAYLFGYKREAVVGRSGSCRGRVAAGMVCVCACTAYLLGNICEESEAQLLHTSEVIFG